MSPGRQRTKYMSSSVVERTSEKREANVSYLKAASRGMNCLDINNWFRVHLKYVTGNYVRRQGVSVRIRCNIGDSSKFKQKIVNAHGEYIADFLSVSSDRPMASLMVLLLDAAERQLYTCRERASLADHTTRTRALFTRALANSTAPESTSRISRRRCTRSRV